MIKRTLTTDAGISRKSYVKKTPLVSLAEKRERIRSLKQAVDAPKLIGTEEELIPFSWRHPLTPPEDGKMTKVYREVVALGKALSFHSGNS